VSKNQKKRLLPRNSPFVKGIGLRAWLRLIGINP